MTYEKLIYPLEPLLLLLRNLWDVMKDETNLFFYILFILIKYKICLLINNFTLKIIKFTKFFNI